jgi:hypothetical protein
MRIVLAATSADPQYGWGKLVALFIAVAVFWALTQAHKRWVATREDPSPTPALDSGVTGVKPQVTAGSDTTSDTTPKGVVAVRSPLDDFVAQQLDKRPTMDVVREAKRRYGKSQATVMRAIRKARGGRGAKP